MGREQLFVRQLCGWALVLILLVLTGCNNAAQSTPTPLPTATHTIAAPTETPAPTPTVIPAGIYVDTTVAPSPINPLVYGTNYGPWVALTTDVMDEYDASGLTFLRFPGGRWGDTRDIKEFDIDRFMDLAARIDADVTISTRLLGGTPEKAAELVRYVNIEEGHDVTYWSVGNEPSLYIDLQDATEWDTDFFNKRWREVAEAMLAVDPDIQLLGPNIHQIAADPAARPKDPNGKDWLEEFLKANGDLVDVVTFHYYPFPDSRTQAVPTFEMLRDDTIAWDAIIPAVRQTIRDITGEDKPIGIGEINSNYTDVSGFDYSPDGYYNAIWWGDTLGRLIAGQVDMVNHFVVSGSRAGLGMLGRTEPRPIYFVYRMYEHFGDQLLFSESDDRYVSVLAAERDDGAITVMLINLQDKSVEKPLQIVGIDTSEAQEVWRLEPDVFAENLGAQSVGDSVELPAQSITLLVFEK